MPPNESGGTVGMGGPIQFKFDYRAAVLMANSFPRRTERELADAFVHSKRKFFKNLASQTKLRVTTGRRGILGRLKGYVNRKPPALGRLSLNIMSYSGIAEIHETGGTIKPKSGRMLRIPVATALSGRKTRPKFRWYPRSRRRSVRDMPNVYTNLSGGRMLSWQARARTADRVLFVMLPRIRITPRLRYYATWEAMSEWITGRLNTGLAKAAEKAGG